MSGSLRNFLAYKLFQVPWESDHNINCCFLAQMEELKQRHEEKFQKFRLHMEEVNSNLEERFELAVTEHAENLAKQRQQYEQKVGGNNSYVPETRYKAAT